MVKVIAGLPFLIGKLAHVIKAGKYVSKIKFIDSGLVEIIPTGHLIHV